MDHDDESDKANLKAVYAILFFGVPNKGMNIESLVAMVGDQPNRFLLESLRETSDVLCTQSRSFSKVFHFKYSQTISFHETQLSQTAKVNASGQRSTKDSIANPYHRKSTAYGK